MGIIIVLISAFAIGAIIINNLTESNFKKETETKKGKIIFVVFALLIGFFILSVLSDSINTCSRKWESKEYLD